MSDIYKLTAIEDIKNTDIPGIDMIMDHINRLDELVNEIKDIKKQLLLEHSIETPDFDYNPFFELATNTD